MLGNLRPPTMQVPQARTDGGTPARRRYPSLVNVLLVTAFALEIGDEGDRLVHAARAVLRHDVHQRDLHVLGHALGVAADVNVGAVGEPRPQIVSDLAHAILYVE